MCFAATPSAIMSSFDATPIKGHEYFLSYQNFPWLKEGTIEQVLHVELLHDDHLYWPDLDVGLTIDMMRKPEHYPLVYI